MSEPTTTSHRGHLEGDVFQVALAAAPPGPGRVRLQRGDEASDSPLASELLSIDGVAEVEIDGTRLTVRKTSAAEWDDLEPRVVYAIDAATMAASGRQAAVPADDDALFDAVHAMFDAEINPSVAQHGGQVDLIDVQDGVVIVRMQGGCQGCGMAQVTLRQGIERRLRQAFGGVVGIRDITDHASGENPYFSSST